MRSIAEWVLDVLIIFGTTFFGLVTLSHIGATWTRRKSFSVASRSPLLASGSGVGLLFRSCSITYEHAMGWHDPEQHGVVDLVRDPAALSCAGMVIMQGVRLLVMYDPNRRRKWGRFTKERPIFLSMLWVFLLLEIALWSAVAVSGVRRIVSFVSSTILPLTLLVATVGALSLAGELRKTDDLCHMARDLRKVGRVLFVSAVIYAVVLVVPMSDLAVKYVFIVLTAISYHPIVWILNIVPAREVVRQGAAGTPERVPLFPYVPRPWAKRNNIIYVAPASIRIEGTSRLGASSSEGDNALGYIMSFVPLRDAFGDFCRKALCSESFQFLVDVSEFKSFDRAVMSPEKDFESFISIVNEYIVHSSPSEVNIDSNSKDKITGHTRRDVYVSLSPQDRGRMFLRAEREVTKMLADNLLTKFEASARYLEISADLGYGTD